MDALASYLMDRVPDGMNYSDAAQLCLRLYCTVDGVPKQLLPLSKEVLGDAFAKLGHSGWVRYEGADSPEIADRGHWVEVIAAILKKGPDFVDMARGEVLARHVGFLSENVAS